MFFIKNCICFLLFYIVVAESRQFRLDYEYDASTQRWFKFHRIPSNWHEARLRCDLEGAVLASPLDVNLLNAMKSLMSKNSDEECGVFSGIHATFSRGDYISIEGVPIFKIPISWAPGEPDNYKDSENCLMLLANGTMADVACSDVFPYICYRSKSSFVITGCGTPDPGYKLEGRTGSCYKFHRFATTWSRAYMTCAAEGGYLSIINSDVESQVLKELFIENPTSTIMSTTSNTDAFIGYHDWGERGTWRTIHGESLDAAGFSKWLGGKPNNLTSAGVGQHCGGVDRSSGLLNDIWCDVVLYAFICEKNPVSLIHDDD